MTTMRAAIGIPGGEERLEAAVALRSSRERPDSVPPASDAPVLRASGAGLAVVPGPALDPEFAAPVSVPPPVGSPSVAIADPGPPA